MGYTWPVSDNRHKKTDQSLRDLWTAVTGTNLSLPTTEKTKSKLLSSSCPRGEKGKNEETGTSPAKPACFCHSCWTCWSRCWGAHDWQGLAAVVAVSHFVSSSALNSAPAVAAWLSQALPRGTELLCCLPAPLPHRISQWLHSVLLCGHKYSSPSGQRQLSTQSHELHTHAMQSLSMCQLDNVTSKARVQK